MASESGEKLLLTRLKWRTKTEEHFKWRTTGGRSRPDCYSGWKFNKVSQNYNLGKKEGLLFDECLF